MPGAKVDTELLTHLHSDHIGAISRRKAGSVPLEVYGPPAPEPKERTADAEGDTFGMSGTEEW